MFITYWLQLFMDYRPLNSKRIALGFQSIVGILTEFEQMHNA